jgi:hypothetical protein
MKGSGVRVSPSAPLSEPKREALRGLSWFVVTRVVAAEGLPAAATATTLRLARRVETAGNTGRIEWPLLDMQAAV